MNKYIIVLVHPFIIGQHICVYEENECKEKIVADFDSAPKKIIEIALLHNIKKIHLKGNKAFTTKIRDNTFKCNNFDKNKMEIIIED